MRRPLLWVAMVLLALAGCTPAQTPTSPPTPTLTRPTRTPPPPPTPIPTPMEDVAYQGRSLPVYQGSLFSTSGVCTPCHRSMTDDSGADVSLDAAWRTSMEANAARDPFFLAVAQAETLRQPDLAVELEDTCAACHMPMARTSVAMGGEPARLFGSGLLDPENELHELAMDGVSCSLCHQISEDGLGLPTSYSGGYSVDLTRPPGERAIYGPYSVEGDQAAIMQSASGYLPTQGLHLGASELCATCHMLFTDDSDGGGFPLQATYLEWFYSDYRRLNSCQDCHMPEAVGGVRIASSSEFPRSPFAQHTFLGGNAYMLGLLGTFAEELELYASGGALDEARLRSLEFLGEAAATIELEEVSLSASRLRVDVRVESQAGHKLPSGFPSRRMWIHFTVTDAAGTLLFESGAWDEQGRISGNAGDDAGAGVEPHYLAIVQPDQVQIYESVLRDAAGSPTTSWSLATAYLKDNRIPPIGYEVSDRIGSIRAWGRAVEDEDFLGGSDALQYSVDLGAAEGPITVSVELLFQSVAPVWVRDLRGFDADHVERFLRFYDSVANAPVVLSSASATLGSE